MATCLQGSDNTTRFTQAIGQCPVSLLLHSTMTTNYYKSINKEASVHARDCELNGACLCVRNTTVTYSFSPTC